METSTRPRRSRISRTPGSNGKTKCQVTSMGTGGVVSPRRTSSLMRGSIKVHANGSLDRDGAPEDSVAEVTVDLSRSSFFSSSTLQTKDAAESQHSQDSFVNFLDSYHETSSRVDDSFPDPYLDNARRRPMKSEPQIPRNNVIEDSIDDFMTACTSQDRKENTRLQPRSPGRSSSLISASFPSSLRVESPSSQSMNQRHQHDRLKRARKEQTYWDTVATNRTMSLGTLNRQTAEALFALGHAHMRLNEYREAMTAFHSSCKIWKALDGPTHLSVGRALDAYGLAALRYQRTGPSLKHAKNALDDAFSIRFHNLGVWHVDTVETYNKIASVYLHMGYLQEACKAYEEVFLVRKAIFGQDHPSVAISAHGLAKVHQKLQDQKAASRYFNIALDVYRTMRLPKEHPTVARLLNDRRRLERYD